MKKYRVRQDPYDSRYYYLVENDVENKHNNPDSRYSQVFEKYEKRSQRLTFNEIVEFAFKYLDARSATDVTIDDYESQTPAKITPVQAEGKPNNDPNKITLMMSQTDKDRLIEEGYNQAKQEFLNHFFKQ